MHGVFTGEGVWDEHLEEGGEGRRIGQREQSGPRMVQADPKGGSAANLGPSQLSEWAIGQVFFPSASLVSHWLRERHDLWEGRDLQWWLAGAGGCGRGIPGSRGTEPFLEGGSGLHISVFIIKGKLRLGAWSLVTLDVIVTPQAHPWHPTI